MCLLYIVYNFCVDDVNAKMGPVNMLLLPADVGYYDLTSILPEGDAMDTTRLSERGQIVIPKRLRTAHGWEAGLEFIVEDAGDSIKLKPIKLFKKTTISINISIPVRPLILRFFLVQMLFCLSRCRQRLAQWLSLELASRLRLTPASAACMAS